MKHWTIIKVKLRRIFDEAIEDFIYALSFVALAAVIYLIVALFFL